MSAAHSRPAAGSLAPVGLVDSPYGVGTASLWLGVLMIALAPLLRGGNRGGALVVLEALALLVLAGLAWARASGQMKGVWGCGWKKWALWLLLASPLWVGVLHLLPLPPALWQALPGREPYIEALRSMGGGASWRPLSLTPEATWVSVLAGVPLGALFLLGLCAPRRWLHRLMVVWLVGALLQAALGLAQLGPYPALYAGSAFQGVIGTFANSNHLAGYLAMSLPLVVWMWQRARREHERTGQGELGVWLWALAGFVLLLTVLAGQSRAGLGTAVVAGCGALLLCGRTLQGWDWRWRVGGFVLAVLLALAALGMQGLRRFGVEVLSADGSIRLDSAVSTWRAVGDFWPAGSGMGSFAGVFARYSSETMAVYFVPHAHNDYVQWLMEGGAAAALCLGLAAALLGSKVWQLGQRLAERGELPDEALRSIAAGLGLLALLSHCWVDFNARIPALAMYGAFLAGVFLRPTYNSKMSAFGGSGVEVLR